MSLKAIFYDHYTTCECGKKIKTNNLRQHYATKFHLSKCPELTPESISINPQKDLIVNTHNPTSGVSGVIWRDENACWEVHYKCISFGFYDSLEEAIKAREKAPLFTR